MARSAKALRSARELNAPFASLSNYVSSDLVVPDPIEFILSDAYLRRRIYPRQGTLIKTIFLREDLFTDYDYDVLEEWSTKFANPDGYVTGVQPDILERLRAAKDDSRPWFREVVFLGGRRGSKSFLGALTSSYVLWNYLALHDPQGHFGIDRDKQLGMFVFANQATQAMSNQWKDIYNVVVGAPCFAPWVPRNPKTQVLQVFAPNDDERLMDLLGMGIEVQPEMASTFVIHAMGSAAVAARGPAAFCDLFDEFALVTKSISKSSSEELWAAATPALDQFRKWAYIYAGSSPYEETGQMYAEYTQALARSDGTDGLEAGTILRPDIVMCQLQSWDLYEDWQRAHEIPLYPGERATYGGTKLTHYPHQVGCPQEYDDEMKRLERANPETFMVERRAQWRTVLDAYFNPDVVDAIFAPWPPLPNQPLNEEIKRKGTMRFVYKAHCDPSDSGDAFGIALAHVVYVKGGLMPHVIFDYIGRFSPSDFPGHHLDYETVMNGFDENGERVRSELGLKELVRNFAPSEMSFDQGYSAWLISEMNKWALREPPKRPTQFFKRTATNELNWFVAEYTKTAAGLGYLHAPPVSSSPAVEQLSQEMKFLKKVRSPGTRYGRVDHPTSGPVTSKDVWDAFSNVVYALVGDRVAEIMGQSFMAAGVHGGLPGGLPVAPYPTNLNTDSPANFLPQRLMGASRRTRQQPQPISRATSKSGRVITPRSALISRPHRWR